MALVIGGQGNGPPIHPPPNGASGWVGLGWGQKERKGRGPGARLGDVALGDGAAEQSRLPLVGISHRCGKCSPGNPRRTNGVICKTKELGRVLPHFPHGEKNELFLSLLVENPPDRW